MPAPRARLGPAFICLTAAGCGLLDSRDGLAYDRLLRGGLPRSRRLGTARNCCARRSRKGGGPAYGDAGGRCAAGVRSGRRGGKGADPVRDECGGSARGRGWIAELSGGRRVSAGPSSTPPGHGGRRFWGAGSASQREQGPADHREAISSCRGSTKAARIIL